MIFKLAQDKVFIKFITPLCTALYCQSKASIGEIEFFLCPWLILCLTHHDTIQCVKFSFKLNDYLTEYQDKVICSKYYKISNEYLTFAVFGQIESTRQHKKFCNAPHKRLALPFSKSLSCGDPLQRLQAYSQFL